MPRELTQKLNNYQPETAALLAQPETASLLAQLSQGDHDIELYIGGEVQDHQSFYQENVRREEHLNRISESIQEVNREVHNEFNLVEKRMGMVEQALYLYVAVHLTEKILPIVYGILGGPLFTLIFIVLFTRVCFQFKTQVISLLINGSKLAYSAFSSLKLLRV